MTWWTVSMFVVFAFVAGLFACPIIAYFIFDERDDDDV